MIRKVCAPALQRCRGPGAWVERGGGGGTAGRQLQYLTCQLVQGPGVPGANFAKAGCHVPSLLRKHGTQTAVGEVAERFGMNSGVSGTLRLGLQQVLVDSVAQDARYIGLQLWRPSFTCTTACPASSRPV